MPNDNMTKEELLRKINTFPLAAAEPAKDMLQGGFRSVFRGQGIEFDEARRYEQGDDVRSIDRNVSARYGTAYVKLYREERELTVFVVLDCSGSMFTGGGADTKLRVIDQAVLASALIAFSAERGGQRFGALFLIRPSVKYSSRNVGEAISWPLPTRRLILDRWSAAPRLEMHFLVRRGF